MIRLFSALALVLVSSLSLSQITAAGVLGQKAPDWQISEWLNEDGGNITDHRGKIVVIDFFQLWCPGCNSFSIPLMHKWEARYEDQVKAGKIKFVSIHTVFEGHRYQTPEMLKNFIKAKGIKHAVGNDQQVDGYHIPLTMLNYKTRGTPEIAIVDQKGIVKFQDNIFKPAKGESIINGLLAN
jgi:thiol-disulfide isomerase/thioredoxin